MPLFTSYPEAAASSVDGNTYDYIVVGGGTAGCVVASRLSEDPNVSVLLLEKGLVKDGMLSRVPLMSQNFLFGDALQVVSDRFSEPVPNAHNLRMKLWTSESLGGASRINGMVFTQGPPADYNAWAEMGLNDWSWDRVEPYFRKSENSIAHPESTYRNHNGPVELRKFKTPFLWGKYLDEAASRLGLPLVEDVNDPTAPAMGLYRLDHAVDSSARRKTAYQAFLNKDIALARRKHLTVCTGVVATQLDINNEDGIVRGVYFRPVIDQNNTDRDCYVEARREVIVCCGALKTPQLLMLSGIGPREELVAHDIPVIRELPHVGKSLSDHYAFPIMLEMPRKETIHILEWVPFAMWHLLLWFFFGTGLMSHGSNTSTIFARTGAIDDQMAIQAHDPETGNDNMDITQPRNTPNLEVMIMAVTSFKRPVPGRSLFTLYPCITQPYSTGMVQLSSTNPLSHPRVTHPTLRDERDWPVARKALRFAMRLAAEFQASGYPYPVPTAFAPGNHLDKLAEWDNTPADGYDAPMAGPNGVQPPLPTASLSAGSSVDHKDVKEPPAPKTWVTVTDEELDSYIRSVATVSLHPSCSCRMSGDSETGVVDQQLRVHGLHNLRIADTSVFPRMSSTHTMWPVIMVAERCADFIKKEWAARGDIA